MAVGKAGGARTSPPKKPPTAPKPETSGSSTNKTSSTDTARSISDQVSSSGESNDQVRPSVSNVVSSLAEESSETPATRPTSLEDMMTPPGTEAQENSVSAPQQSLDTDLPPGTASLDSVGPSFSTGQGESDVGVDLGDLLGPDPATPEPNSPAPQTPEPESTPQSPPQITTSTNEAGDSVTDFGNGMQTIQAEDGTTTQIHSYEQDGTSYRNTIRFNPDGTSTMISAATDPSGVTRTTELNRSTMEGNIEDAPGVPEREVPVDRPTNVYPHGEDSRTGLPEGSEREPLEVVNTRQTVTNADGETVPVSESTTYSQSTVPEVSSSSYAPNGKVLPIQGDTEVNHQTSYSTTTTFDENGNPVTENTWTDKDSYTGTGADGQEVSSTEETSATEKPNGEIHTQRTVDERGVYTKSDLESDNATTSLRDYPEVLGRLAEGDNDYVDVRTTNSEVVKPGETIDLGGRDVVSIGASSEITDYGNYDDPEADGTSARVTENFDAYETNAPNRLVELRDVSNDGNNIDEQLFVPGTERTMITRTRMEPEGLPPGSMTMQSEVKDGDKLVQTTNNTLRVVDPSEVAPVEIAPGVPAPGVSNPTNLADGEMVNSFLETADGQIVMNSQEVKNYDENGENPTTTTATAYSAENGQELRIVTGPEGTATGTAAPDGTAQIHDPIGGLLQQNADGQVTLNGAEVPPGYEAAKTGLSAGTTLNNLAQAATGQKDVLGRGFSNSLDALGVAFSAFDAGRALVNGEGLDGFFDAAEEVGSAATSWNALGQALGQGGEGPRALQVARNVAKFAGPAAVGLSGATAVRDFVDGDIEAGTLAASSTLGSALLIAGSRLGVFAGPVGWGISGLTGAYVLADEAGLLDSLPWKDREIPDYKKIAPVQIG